MRSLVVVFAERYTEEQEGVEEPDELLVKVGEALEAAENLADELSSIGGPQGCPLCFEALGEHAESCAVSILREALAVGVPE